MNYFEKKKKGSCDFLRYSQNIILKIQKNKRKNSEDKKKKKNGREEIKKQNSSLYFNV